MVNRNLPNYLSILRIFMSFFVIYFLLQRSLHSTIIAAIIFIFASITDFLDGFIARKYNLITKFGKIVDPTADKFLILGAFITFSILNLFSFWWLVPIILREVGVTIERLREYIKGSKKEVAARVSGKIKTIIQIITIVVLFSVLILQEYSQYGALENVMNIIMYGLLIVTIVLTIYSGIRFLMKKGLK